MKSTLWAAIGVLLAAPLPALAQQHQQQHQQSHHSHHLADPADPRAAVPPPVYESAFTRSLASAPTPGQDAPTPDKLWRAANDAVAGAQGHSGHAGHAGHAAVQAPAVPAAPAARPAGRPATGHGAHH